MRNPGFPVNTSIDIIWLRRNHIHFGVRNITIHNPWKVTIPFVTKHFRYLKWKYWTFSLAILWVGFPLSHIHTAYIDEDPSILGTWNAWWIWKGLSRWWFQTCFYFHHENWGKILQFDLLASNIPHSSHIELPKHLILTTPLVGGHYCWWKKSCTTWDV